MKDFNFWVRNSICMQITKTGKHWFSIWGSYSLSHNKKVRLPSITLAAQSQVSANLLVFLSCNQDICSSSSHQHSRHQKGRWDDTFIPESKTFVELPSRCLFVSHWLELHYLTTPYKGDGKVCFLTGNGHPKQNWGLVSRERGKHDIGEAASCFCHNQQEIHYISRSPEAEQAAGSIQRCRQRPRNTHLSTPLLIALASVSGQLSSTLWDGCQQSSYMPPCSYPAGEYGLLRARKQGATFKRRH